eukprot:TRINITY_DN22685_c0_g1_i1.p1 TRINITY_DN22685_c0_g1~~TRINITY_DN22685_c0_g1_i1.p1  ORF type:complete len:649 (+),score=90.07 TRINITY_DN22685_c0_g1_i1:38-1984(+)
MSARPDILNSKGSGGGHRRSELGPGRPIPSSLTSSPITRFQHHISLGPRCTNTSSVYKAQRKYAGPFDWIFSSPRIVVDCLRDGFASYLDASALYEVATVFDAVGLPPGSAPRDRKLVGHTRYSEMTEGVGRGVIFNHHNPLTDEGYKYISRCAQRFMLALRLDEQKLYSFINIDRKLWDVDAVSTLFEELARRDHGGFLLIVVNCIKNCGDVARQEEPVLLEQRQSGKGTLKVLEVKCIGDNKGSYFHEPFDAQRVKALIVDPYSFALSEDPLTLDSSCFVEAKADVQAAVATTGRRWSSGKVQDAAVEEQQPEAKPEAEASRKSRWGRKRGEESARVDIREDTCSNPRIHLTLRSGLQMPTLGLGTWQLAADGECRRAVDAALQCGCTLVDTAAAYKNEQEVGAVLASKKRSDIFLVTKLQTKEHGDRTRVLSALRASLRRLGVDYVDLYLMHSPRGGFVLETWDAMLEARDAGLTKAVGVSNFGVKQLEGLKAAGRELPEVNQIECHLWLQQRECVAWCAKQDVAIMAYSPLARGKCFGRADVVSIAERVGCSAAQVAIRWGLSKGFVVIPKSANPDRVKQNMSALHAPLLEAEVLVELDKFDCGFQSCAAASDAMQIPWERIAESGDLGKGCGKGKSKVGGKGY